MELTEWESKHFFSIPTEKKRIRLGLLQYKHLLTGLEDAVGPAFSENKDDKSHVGANVFLSVKRDNPFVDLRQYWKPPNVVYKGPIKKGWCMRPLVYKTLKFLLSEIPKLKNVVKHDHQLGML